MLAYLRRARDEGGGLIHRLLDASDCAQAAAALATLLGPRLGATLGKRLNEGLNANDVIVILAQLPWKWPASPLEQ